MAIDEEGQATSRRQIEDLAWENVNVTAVNVRLRKSHEILKDVRGFVKKGEMLAIMGPSGSGKTTLLTTLAQRPLLSKTRTQAEVYMNRSRVTDEAMRFHSAYVEQYDVLVGALTVNETLDIAAKLALPPSVSPIERKERVARMIRSFGLENQKNSIIGTSVHQGISGGQKRRVSVACQLITDPSILFIDELTSGLDSAAALEIVRHMQNVARVLQIMIVATIHQPSNDSFQMFDRLLLLARGRTVFCGRVKKLTDHFITLPVSPTGTFFGVPLRNGLHQNAAEHILSLVTTDFEPDIDLANSKLRILWVYWHGSDAYRILKETLRACHVANNMDANMDAHGRSERANVSTRMLALMQRSSIKSQRDVIAYRLRIAMYLGLALLMGTIWLRLEPSQDNIQAFINAIFFGGAFMSFMAVAYIPAFLEDRGTFVKERANGLYGSWEFLLANFLTGLPYLFFIAVLFSVIAYWLSNFNPTAKAFFTWVMWLFLELVAAESLVVFISTLFPIFVVALAATASINGIWMCTGGFLIKIQALNPFWRYAFHYIDYQSYVFQGMVVNEFEGRNYTCAVSSGDKCECQYKSPLESHCLIAGAAVLEESNILPESMGKSIIILLGIIATYRLLSVAVLWVRKT